MKKLITILAVTMLAAYLPARPLPINLSILTTSDGGLQILASGIESSPTHPILLQSTTNFVGWTSVRTNVIEYPFTGTLTNMVEPTNSMTFYKVYVTDS